MCNPYYSAYVAGAVAVGAEPVFLNATKATGFLPDLDEIRRDESLLRRTVALFINSPANPQGAVADRQYILKALELARGLRLHAVSRRMLFRDLHGGGADRAVWRLRAGHESASRNLVVFNSLSKALEFAGLEVRLLCGRRGVPRNLWRSTEHVRADCASARAARVGCDLRDEAHVERSRDAYREKFDIADKVLGDRYGYKRPAGGFCLWLDLSQFGGGSQAAVTLWQRAGVKVIPGSFLAQTGRDGTNPGANYVRVAMVQDPTTIRKRSNARFPCCVKEYVRRCHWIREDSILSGCSRSRWRTDC